MQSPARHHHHHSAHGGCLRHYHAVLGATTMTRASTAMLLAVSMTVGCQPPAAGPDGEPGTTSSAAATPPTPVKEIPAIDRQRYPDNLGYLYEGQVSTILWMQNRPTLTGIDHLASELRQTIRNGLIGDTVAT